MDKLLVEEVIRKISVGCDGVEEGAAEKKMWFASRWLRCMTSGRIGIWKAQSLPDGRTWQGRKYQLRNHIHISHLNLIFFFSPHFWNPMSIITHVFYFTTKICHLHLLTSFNFPYRAILTRINRTRMNSGCWLGNLVCIHFVLSDIQKKSKVSWWNKNTNLMLQIKHLNNMQYCLQL
jgi:hypothetical protein